MKPILLRLLPAHPRPIFPCACENLIVAATIYVLIGFLNTSGNRFTEALRDAMASIFIVSAVTYLMLCCRISCRSRTAIDHVFAQLGLGIIALPPVIAILGMASSK